MKHRTLGALASTCGLLGLAVSILMAISVNEYLEDASKINGGGLPYATAFFIAGLAFSISIFYVGYLFFTRWNSEKFILSIQAVIVTCMTVAVISTVWFILKTELFNIVGVIGLLVAVPGGFLSLAILNQVKDDIDDLQEFRRE